MNIGVVARLSGVSVTMVSYYERIGLVGGVSRGRNGDRCFSEKELLRLIFIRRARFLGCSIDVCRMLLDSFDERCMTYKKSRQNGEGVIGEFPHTIELERLYDDLAELKGIFERNEFLEKPAVEDAFH